MSIHNWLHNLRSAFTPGKRPRKTRRRFAQRYMPNCSQVESLEDRRLLTFVPAVNYPVGASPQEVVTADFNNDSILDVAVANGGSDNVSVLLGSANGTFGPAITSPFRASTSIAVGDFDNDGYLDLAAVDRVQPLMSLVFGKGDGSFEAPSVNFLDPSTDITHLLSVAVGDFNDDGTMDLAVTSAEYYDFYYETLEATVLLSNGDRTFSAQPSAFVELDNRTLTTVVTDFDGDDDLDLLVGIYGDFVHVLVGDGEGHLVLASDHWVIGDAGLASMAVGDVDRDGVLDLVAQDLTNVKVRLGNGLGGFQSPPGGQSYAAGARPISVVLGDFDRDGNLDIATANFDSNDVSFLRGHGDGTFALPEQFAAGAGAISITAGDFNGDGWLDLATANFNGSSVSILVNDQSWPPAPNSLAISDMTVTEGDGGTVAAVFTVMRSGDLAGTTTVAYSTANGGALAGSDYIAGSGTIVFAPGEATRTITNLVIGDLTDEWDQGFYVNLSAASSGTVITDGQGFGTIADNDPPPTITITSIVSAKEGNNNATKLFNFAVTLSAASEKEVRVNFATANGTATTADGDYIAQSGTLIFAPGTTSRTISIQVKGDKKRESNERFFVNLTDATNATIAAPQGIGEILDDDAPGRKG